eukprot:Tamp_08879.p1 GENE.Tamp_08879~~Tamp_08879.p1  ORF type:complete len:530 (-),score=73.40 Tamp_08879:672-2027(-)
MRGMLRAAACTALLASHAHAGALGPGSLGFSAPCTSGLAPLASAPHRACAGGAGASSTRPQHVAMIGGGGRRSARRLTGPGARMAMSSDSFVKAGGSDDAAAPLGDAAGSPAVVQKNWLQVLWDFSRPHTIVGSVLSVVSLHLFAATAPGATLLNLSALGVALAWAIVCAVLVNIYVTGLNQVFDVEIDKINKPYLPIAAGQLSLPAAWAICVGALLLGTVPSILFYPFDKAPLLTVTVGSALLGTAYSAPPTRLKRFPLFAALCIIVVRGTLVNLGFYAHAAQALGGAMLPARAWIASFFFGLFGCVIALVKDVPDVGGDRSFAIKTLSVRLGAPAVLLLGTRILSATLLLAAACCVYGGVGAVDGATRAARLLVAAAGAAAAVWVERSSASLLQTYGSEGGSVEGAGSEGSGASLSASQESVFCTKAFEYYMHLWKLFYGAYLLLPFAL